MRRLCYIPILLAVLPGFADFDADAWNAKNATMSVMAARMKAAYAQYAAKATDPAEDVTVPFETFDTGDIKATVIAKRAQFFHDTNCVWAEDVIVEQFHEDGSLDFRLDAKHCLVDRAAKCCWFSGPAKAVHRKTTLEGVDAFYCSSNGFLKVMTNVHVTSEDIKMKGLKL